MEEFFTGMREGGQKSKIFAIFPRYSVDEEWKLLHLVGALNDSRVCF